MKVSNPKLRYVVYARKSTDSEDRQVQSVDDQLRELEPIITQNSLNVVRYFEESKSAKRRGRPMFNEMMDMIQNGKADGIICWKPNRLSRNAYDGGLIQGMLTDNIIQSIVTPSKEHLPQDNVMLLTVELGMANQFSLDLGRDVSRGMQSKANKGWLPEKAPLGYLNDPLGLKGEKKIFIDEERFPLVRKMWDLMLTGNYTVKQLRDLSHNEWGLKTRASRNLSSKMLSLSGAYRIFTNTFYYGEYSYKGEVIQGKHQPMVTKEEFDRVQKLLGRAGKPRPKYKRLPFNGVIRCGECGSMITCDEKVKRSKQPNVQPKHYLYHRCTGKSHDSCFQEPITYQDLANQITGYLGSITISQELLEWSLKILRQNNQIEDTNRSIIIKNLKKDLESVSEKNKNLIDLFLSGSNKDRSMLTEEEYINQKNTFTAEKSRIEGELRKIETNDGGLLELTEKTFEFATYARSHFQNGDYETQTRILLNLGQKIVLKDKKLVIELQKPYSIIKNGLEKMSSIMISVEQEERLIPKRKNTPLESVYSMWSGQGESNPYPFLGKEEFYH